MAVIQAIKIRRRYLLIGLAFFAVLLITVHILSTIREQKNIEVLSVALSGRVIVIDPGHGGKDRGAQSEKGTLEKNINLEVSKRLAGILKQAGASVILTRETDIWLADPNASHKKRSDLLNRVEIANRAKAHAFISIHTNSYPLDRSQRGAQVFSQPGSEEGLLLAESVQSELTRLLKNTHRQPKQIDYFIRHSNVPAVIIEIGFLSNQKEEKLLLESAYQSKMAYSIYCGLVKYFAEKANKES